MVGSRGPCVAEVWSPKSSETLRALRMALYGHHAKLLYVPFKILRCPSVTVCAPYDTLGVGLLCGWQSVDGTYCAALRRSLGCSLWFRKATPKIRSEIASPSSSPSVPAWSLFIFCSVAFRAVCVCQRIWLCHVGFSPAKRHTNTGRGENLWVTAGRLWFCIKKHLREICRNFLRYYLFSCAILTFLIGLPDSSKVTLTTGPLTCCCNSFVGISPQIWFPSGATGRTDFSDVPVMTTSPSFCVHFP